MQNTDASWPSPSLVQEAINRTIGCGRENANANASIHVNVNVRVNANVNKNGTRNAAVFVEIPLPPPLVRVGARYFLTSPKHRSLFDRQHCFLLNRASRERWSASKSTSTSTSTSKSKSKKKADRTLFAQDEEKDDSFLKHKKRNTPRSPLEHHDAFRSNAVPGSNDNPTCWMTTSTPERNSYKDDRAYSIRAMMEQIRTGQMKQIGDSMRPTTKSKLGLVVTTQFNRNEPSFLEDKQEQEQVQGQEPKDKERWLEPHHPSSVPSSPKHIGTAQNFGSGSSTCVIPTPSNSSSSSPPPLSKGRNIGKMVSVMSMSMAIVISVTMATVMAMTRSPIISLKTFIGNK